MYIDEKLIKILNTHRNEEIHVNYAIEIIEKIAKEYENMCYERNIIRDAMIYAVKDITGRVLRDEVVDSIIEDFYKNITE